MNYLFNKSKAFVENYFSAANSNLYYHNINHIREVVEHSEIIANYLKISAEDKEILLIAAWFHDIYHVITHVNHEVKSAEIAEDFLLSENFPKYKIKKVVGCILATRVPQKPRTLLQKIICDADLFHAGTIEFTNRNALYKKEILAKINKKISDYDFIKQTLIFFDSHSFFTDYSKKFLNKQKQLNMNELKNLLKDDNETTLSV